LLERTRRLRLCSICCIIDGAPLSVTFGMSTPLAPYTKDELIRLVVDALPTRGAQCPKCGVLIPQFADLSDHDRGRILHMIFEGRNMMAMHELRAITMCPLAWAKIWVLHSGRPDAMGTTAPCPYCGKPLKTALAKQCPHCNMDWHDPARPRRLGSAEPGAAQNAAPPHR
jgi:hypothetical protein